jgi:hypothetical protein
MGSTGQQELKKPPQTAMRKDGVPVNVTPLRDDARDPGLCSADCAKGAELSEGRIRIPSFALVAAWLWLV